MAEIWDAYDKNFMKLKNTTLIRGEPIPDGMYHLVGEVIVKHTDGTYLIMQRDFKKNYGGMWELTAGGSAWQGETPLACAIRELKEETGIEAADITEIGRFVHDGHHTLYVEYLCVTNRNKNAVTLQKGETIHYRWVDKKSLLDMSQDELISSRAMKLIRISDI
ncbi:MAG: NUDIX domain-containing protein [Eubacteriales bacterium]